MADYCCAHCGKEGAKMQCPKCKQLGLPPTIYCEQACFKLAWAAHKAVHAFSQESMTQRQKAMFRFTGSVRPGNLTPAREVPEAINRPDYMAHPRGMSKLEEQSYGANKMPVLKGDELAAMREACRLTREVIDIGIAAARVGVTTDEIDRVVHEATVARDMYPSPLGYNGFKKSCCTSVNEVICHGIPDSRELQYGDTLNLDVSCFSRDGFHGDVNETFFIGDAEHRPTAASVKLVHSGYECMMAGFAIVKPGALYKHIGNAISSRADQDGYQVVRSIMGHGIGRLFHCAPQVPHYAGNKSVGVMRAGHVFTVEPMVNEGTHMDVDWPDSWTIATADGKPSSMFEQTCVVTEAGYEFLTAAPGFVPHYRKQLAEWGMVPLDAVTSDYAA
jgi:methionyl aminopeptidase